MSAGGKFQIVKDTASLRRATCAQLGSVKTYRSPGSLPESMGSVTRDTFGSVDLAGYARLAARAPQL